MVVVPAVAAAVAAPLLTLCSARLERRRVLVGLSALVVVSDVIAGLAPGIGVMLAARPGPPGTTDRAGKNAQRTR